MWKKTDTSEDTETNVINEVSPQASPTKTFEKRITKSVVGPSISFKGDITGEEDLLIEGKIEGAINFPSNTVTVGRQGELNANIYAKIVIVEGQLTGDIYADEQVAILRSGNVLGNITAPRVSLEDGAKLKGRIDMDPKVVDELLSKQQSATTMGITSLYDTKTESVTESVDGDKAKAS